MLQGACAWLLSSWAKPLAWGAAACGRERVCGCCRAGQTACMGGSSMWQGACVTVHSRSNSAGDDIVTCANQNVLLSGACPPRKLMLLRGGQGRMHACMHACMHAHLQAAHKCMYTHAHTNTRARPRPSKGRAPHLRVALGAQRARLQQRLAEVHAAAVHVEACVHVVKRVHDLRMGNALIKQGCGNRSSTGVHSRCPAQSRYVHVCHDELEAVRCARGWAG